MNGLKNVRNRRDDSLSRVGWADFETLLADFYRRRGYQVEHVGTGRAGGRFDGGVDLKMRKDDEFIVVQCKHWNAKQVPHNDVHELLGIMVNEGATGAILITSGEFTAYAKEAAAKQGHVQLIDGDALRAMIGPLPESMIAPLESDSRTHAEMSEGDERLLASAGARIRRGRAPRSHYDPLIQVVMFFLFAALVWVVMRSTLEGVRSTMAQSAARSAAHIAQSHGSQQQMQPSSMLTVSPIVVTASSHRPSASIIPTSDAEMREWKRKNAESMKILEKTTPQLKR